MGLVRRSCQARRSCFKDGGRFDDFLSSENDVHGVGMGFVVFYSYSCVGQGRLGWGLS